MHALHSFIDNISNFPKPGVVFRDLSRLLRTNFMGAIDAMSVLFSEDEWASIDVIAGVESRGFIFASALAYKHNKGFILIRKEGKLPNVAAQKSFDLEYGSATLEVQAGTGRCLLLDDILATGGTLAAAADLCTLVGYDVQHIAVFANIKCLNDFSWKGLSARAVLTF